MNDASIHLPLPPATSAPSIPADLVTQAELKIEAALDAVLTFASERRATIKESTDLTERSFAEGKKTALALIDAEIDKLKARRAETERLWDKAKADALEILRRSDETAAANETRCAEWAEDKRKLQRQVMSFVAQIVQGVMADRDAIIGLPQPEPGPAPANDAGAKQEEAA